MKIISLDLEFNQPSNTIIQVGCVVGDLKTGEILKKYSQYIYTEEILDERIIKLTGIQPSDVATGKPLKDVYEDLKQLHDFYQCFRNSLTWGGGDSEALRKELKLDNEIFLFGRRWLDAKTLYVSYRIANEQNKQAGLAKALLKLGLQFKGRKHDACDDALNTFIIYRELLNKFKKDKL